MPPLPALNRSAAVLHPRDDCEPRDPLNTLTDRLNILLNSSGPGYTLPLCPSVQYIIQAPILFAAPNQEISTVGYPAGDDRATLVVDGPVANGQGHTTAVDGTCNNCSGVKLRYVQVSPLLCLLQRWPQLGLVSTPTFCQNNTLFLSSPFNLHTTAVLTRPQNADQRHAPGRAPNLGRRKHRDGGFKR